ncbi:hypothetical protein C8C84_0206 [Flavobacterium sp. 102]|nr:hypothetical protein C8C84_0206 [Flavobacterium sp. 102]
MRAEEVYNIAIHLPEKELERLYTLLEKRVCKKPTKSCKTTKKKLITDQEARLYILKTVFKIDISVLQ